MTGQKKSSAELSAAEVRHALNQVDELIRLGLVKPEPPQPILHGSEEENDDTDK